MNPQKDPMPLRDLPQYLESLKENNSFGDGPVVDMGQIISEEPYWYKRFAYAAAACLLIGAGFFTYSSIPNRNITIVIEANNASPQAIADIVSDGGGQIISVKQNEDSTYEVKLFALKNINSFIERLRKNKTLKDVQLEK